MKILITNNALNQYYGTETWVYSMAKELVKKHTVDCFTFHRGLMSDRILEFCSIVSVIDNDYDLALINHSTCFDKVPKDIFRVFTSHSLINAIELFPEGANKNIAISEEIAKDKYQIIRNGVDCERFNSFRPINKELKTILYLSHPDYGGAGKDILKEACKEYELLIIDQQIFDMPSLINKADLVIGFGRGVLEAMACGRNVISADYRPYYMDSFCGGGMVSKDTFDDLQKDNFTGRWRGQIDFDIERIKEEISKYNPGRGMWLRDRIFEDHNIEKITKQYLDLKRGE